ncbi:MAG: hypothetical protein LBE27_08400, partial [Deltaproteobacteria bacterium]|nr:hypothetical protein [Deltaproteobacteria bacterium]
YTITGTTRDGTYLDITMNRPSLNPNLTPPGCDYLGSSSKLANGCGKVVTNLKSQARAFIFRHVSTGAQNLPNPLQLSAKYGGFNDRNRNGVPDRGEWEGRDGLPSNYFQAANIAELPHKLETAFKSIAENPQLKRASAPSIYSLPGGGISLETVYYPLYANPENGSERVSWVGTIFALFVDKYGNLREDSDHDLRLTVVNGPKGIIGDHVVSFNPDNSQASSHPCKGISETLSRCFDPYGNNQLQHFTGEKGSPKNIHKIVPIFDTGHWLSSLDSQKILLGPRKHTTPATITNGQRRIYYAYLENSGKSASDNYKTSLLDSSPGSLTARNFLSRVIFDNYQEALPGFKSKLEAAEALVAWVQGVEHPKLRNRSIGDPWTDDHAKVVWRLGDIVNSKPIALGPPASNFHLFYKDLDYLAFVEKYKSRRRMVYFGANDGMLHAVNLGFASYPRGGAHGPAIALTPGNKVPATPHELGAELWAFIPASVLPHLSWLASPLYKHSYYVDQKPLITDAKIKGEWRTILIAGLGLGGRPIMKPTAEDPQAAKSPYYFSEVFCLDITDPEKEPVLLWRHSEMELGLSVGLPQVISSEGKFYCIIPSGPMSDTLAPKSEPPSINYGFKSGYDGYSKQNARLIVIDLDKGEEVSQGKSQKDFLVAPEPDSFFNNPFLPIAQRRELPWSNHALYYGLTISRGLEHCEDKGAVYRLQLADEKGKPLPVSSWKLRRFFNTARPVSAAVNSTYDSHGNLFVIFGTGKLFGEDDLRPCATMPSDRKCLENHEQYLYGLKEDLSDEGFMTFADRSSEESAILDLSGAQLRRNGYVVNIKANKILTIPTGGSVPYQAVQNAIASPKVLGYKRKLESGKLFYPKEPHSNEMVLSQVKLVSRGNGGSLAVFTSFEPTIKGCGSGSYAYLHMVDSFTGLPHPDSSDIFFPASTKESAKTDEVLPGVITLGEGLPTEAFLEETAQGTKVSALDSESGVHTLQIPKASSVHSGVVSWKEVQDRGFGLSKKAMSMGLEY